MADFIQVFTTTDTKRVADRIARALLQKRLASCVQILGPVRSQYKWRGRIESAREWVCLVKARTRDYPMIEATVKQLHDYDVPEIIALPIVKGSKEYLSWVRSETKR